MRRYAGPGRLTLVTAAHGPIEAANALRKLVLRAVLSADDGRRAIDALDGFDIALDSTSRLRRIWSLRNRMSAYDAAYAATAEALRAPLLTVDERLLRACRDAGIPATDLDEITAAG